VAIIQSDNIRSIKVLKKIELEFEQMFACRKMIRNLNSMGETYNSRLHLICPHVAVCFCGGADAAKWATALTN